MNPVQKGSEMIQKSLPSAKAMEVLVSQYQSSGLSVKVFSQGKGIAIPKMQYWIRKIRLQNRLRKRHSNNNFSPVKIVTESNTLCGRIEIQYCNGTRLFLDGINEMQLVRDLIYIKAQS